MTVMDSQKARDQEVQQKNEETIIASTQAAENPSAATPS
jgi:hypothetical protein